MLFSSNSSGFGNMVILNVLCKVNIIIVEFNVIFVLFIRIGVISIRTKACDGCHVEKRVRQHSTRKLKGVSHTLLIVKGGDQEALAVRGASPRQLD